MTRPLALATALASLAFAPAPYLEKKKPPSAPLQGLWEVVAGEGVRGKGGRQTTVIRIEPARWTFLNRSPAGTLTQSAQYHLKVRPGALVSIELRRNEAAPQAYGKGVLRITGDEMRLSYGWGESLPHPTGLDPPLAGRINFTLRRVKEPSK